jgi:Na+/H+ antiporter NhaD/arsenite permease-like protein
MVAAKWGWDFNFMISHFGYKAALAVVLNGLVLATLFRRELLRLPPPASRVQSDAVPLPVILVHLLFLAGVVVFAHYPPVFMGLFMAFLGFTHAYQKHQSPLMLREALLVAFFLGGLVVLGGMQAWWLQPALMAMSETQVFFGALGLTAITDNAALTYLASLVEGLSPSFQYAVVAGAVAGGGLTVIANAPNPAGLALLRKHFPDQAVQPGLLLLAALPPTIVAVLAFRLL